MIDDDGNDRVPGLVPRPDPTILTTQALAREIASLKEIIFTRLDGMDKALNLLQAFTNRQPTIGELAASVDGQFKAIEHRLAERDVRFRDAAVANNAAVEAAFAAQKEVGKELNFASSAAITKAENATNKELDSIKALLALANKSNEDRNSDTRDRITTIESSSAAQGRMFGYIVAAITVVAVIIGAVAVFAGG